MFQDHLKSYGILSDSDLSLLENKTYERHIPKNGFFVKEGEISKEVAFVKSGKLRSFYYSSKGEEVTYCFVLSDSLISAYSSFITQTKSQENIQALTDVQLTCVSRAHLLELEKKSHNWLKLSRLIAQQAYINLEKRIFMLQKETAEKRYLDLVKNQPELLQLVTLEQLSSYLGVSQRHLSRIRGQVSN